jgi:hypothetical protein
VGSGESEGAKADSGDEPNMRRRRGRGREARTGVEGDGGSRSRDSRRSGPDTTEGAGAGIVKLEAGSRDCRPTASYSIMYYT